MPTISTDDVTRVAHLGRLHLTPKEIGSATTQLNDILEHFSAIQSIDTATVPSADDVSGLTNITRADHMDEALCTPAALLERAPQTQQGHIQVRAVFE